MTQQIVAQTDYFTMWYHPEKKIVHHQFHKFIYGKPFRDALMTGVDVLQKYGAHKWLSDDRNNTAIPQEDLEWGRNVWIPAAVKAGWQYWAIVWPQDVIGKMNMKEIIEVHKKAGITVLAFSDPEAGLKWLESI